MPAECCMFTPRLHRSAVPALLFIGLYSCYVSISPGTIAGMGYTSEEIRSGERLLTMADAWRKGVAVPPVIWAHHGPLPVLLDLPFLAAGKFVRSPDFMLSFEPPLATAAVLTVLFLWLRKLGSESMSLLLTITGAFCTMLWPYAYIGLETKQSLFLFWAGYLGAGLRAHRGLVSCADICRGLRDCG